METILQTAGLSKRYKNQLVVDGVNIRIEKGDIYGFVGENGSGKTTVIRLITGLIAPSAGGFTLFGVKNDDEKILSARSKVGAIVESPSIYLNLTAKENLKMQQTLLGRLDEDKCKAILEKVGLGELYSSNKKAGNFSLGMRQRLGIAMALLGDPEFILLDEPMNGLDPAGIVEIRELILQLNRVHGITFLISSHILSELALVANKYGIISKGKLVREITAEELKTECRPSTFLYAYNEEGLYQTLSVAFAREDLVRFKGGVRILGKVDLNAVFAKLNEAGVAVSAVNSREASIEEFYLSLLGVHNA